MLEMENMDPKRGQNSKGATAPVADLSEGLRGGPIKCGLEMVHIFSPSTKSSEGALWILCT